MNLHQLRVFCAIVDKGSFRGAAESLFLSQPSISQHIASLEKHYGVHFFERARRKVTLTPEGRALYTLASDLLRQADAIPDRFRDMQMLRYGSIRIGVTPHACRTLLPRAIRAFHADYPDVNVGMVIENTSRSVELLRSGVTEFLVLGRDLTTPPEPAFVSRALGYDDLVLILPPGHPWSGRTVTPQELEGADFIHYVEDCPLCSFVSEYLKRAGVKCRRVLDVNAIQPAEDLVAAGTGVAIICRSQVEDALRSGRVEEALLQGLEFFRWELQFLFSKAKGLSYAGKELEKRIVGVCGEIFRSDIRDIAPLDFSEKRG